MSKQDKSTKSMKTSKRIVFCAVCIALCVVLPMAFHAIPNGGTLFSPMHIPVLLCGLICGAKYGLLCGIFGPLLSSLLTGMPGAGYLPQMMIELAAYGFFSGLFANIIHLGNGFADLMVSLIGAMLAGRVIAGLARALIFAKGSYAFSMWFASFFANMIPGLILHIVLIPVVVYALQKSRLIPERF